MLVNCGIVLQHRLRRRSDTGISLPKAELSEVPINQITKTNKDLKCVFIW